MLFCKPKVLPKLTEKLTSERKGKSLGVTRSL